jgi:hypothetical protein
LNDNVAIIPVFVRGNDALVVHEDPQDAGLPESLKHRVPINN